jgi:hypothetical protein
MIAKSSASGAISFAIMARHQLGSPGSCRRSSCPETEDRL